MYVYFTIITMCNINSVISTTAIHVGVSVSHTALILLNSNSCECFERQTFFEKMDLYNMLTLTTWMASNQMM